MKNIIETQNDSPVHIYLVDNASKAAMPKEVSEYLAAYKEKITFLQADENRGYAAGNNLGILRALADGCENLIIANNDITFQKHAVKELVRSLDVEKRIGIAGPKVVNEKKETQASRCSMKTGIVEVFQLFTAAKLLFRRKWRRYYCLNQDPDQAAFVYYVSGCCFAMSKECALSVTPLDEGTVLYNEEMILGIWMERKNYRTYYNPKSVVVHQHGSTTGKGRPFMHQCICQSELYYCRKYLHAKQWQLFLLYQYRRGLYRLRCIKDPVLRKYKDAFLRETKAKYREGKALK